MYLKPAGSLWFVYFVFSLVFAGMEDLILVFPPISQLLQATNNFIFSCFTYLSLEPWQMALWCYIVRLAGNNSLINLVIIRILASLKLFFNHEFCCRLPNLNDMYNNSKIVHGEKPWGLWDCQNSINHIMTN